MERLFETHVLFGGAHTEAQAAAMGAEAAARALDEELKWAREGIEKFLMSRLHGFCFCVDERVRREDATLASHCAALQSFLLPMHLEVPRVFWEQGAEAENTYEDG